MRWFFSPKNVLEVDSDSIAIVYDGIAYFNSLGKKINLIENNKRVVSHDKGVTPKSVKKGICTWYDDYSGDLVTSFGDFWHTNRQTIYYGIIELHNNTIFGMNPIENKYMIFDKKFNPLYNVEQIDGSFFMETPPFLPLKLTRYRQLEGIKFFVVPIRSIVYDEFPDGYDVLQQGVVFDKNCKRVLVKENVAYISPLIANESIVLIKCDPEEIDNCIKFPETGDIIKSFHVDNLRKVCTNWASTTYGKIYFGGNVVVIDDGKRKLELKYDHIDEFGDVISEFGMVL